jgi:GNAT superfamily N-acetyltransferase
VTPRSALEVVPYRPVYLAQATTLFVDALRRLRRRVPALPHDLTERDPAEALLGGFLHEDRALVALQGSRVVGYLGWWVVDRFRDTPRRGAYSPEFGHAAAPSGPEEVELALYRDATRRWADSRCELHALTSLAGQPALEQALFANGFGMVVADALRPLTPVPAEAPPGVVLRRAVAADADRLAALDVEHRRHYTAPPVFMAPHRPDSAADIAAFLAAEPDTIWLAEAAGEPQAFLRLEPVSDGAARISLAPTTISITGAFTRPAWRGRGVAAALLAQAVRHYAAHGFQRMAVDYETFNPGAAAFWRRFFDPVAVSVVRVLEHP